MQLTYLDYETVNSGDHSIRLEIRLVAQNIALTAIWQSLLPCRSSAQPQNVLKLPDDRFYKNMNPLSKIWNSSFEVTISFRVTPRRWFNYQRKASPPRMVRLLRVASSWMVSLSTAVVWLSRFRKSKIASHWIGSPKLGNSWVT